MLNPWNLWLDSSLRIRVIQRLRLSFLLIFVAPLYFYLHLYIYQSNLIRNIYLTDLLSLSYISTNILLEELEEISSIEVSVDLIKLYISILEIELNLKNTNKKLIINPFLYQVIWLDLSTHFTLTVCHYYTYYRTSFNGRSGQVGR